jgi:hypothetical protein
VEAQYPAVLDVPAEETWSYSSGNHGTTIIFLVAKNAVKCLLIDILSGLAPDPLRVLRPELFTFFMRQVFFPGLMYMLLKLCDNIFGHPEVLDFKIMTGTPHINRCPAYRA